MKRALLFMAIIALTGFDARAEDSKPTIEIVSGGRQGLGGGYGAFAYVVRDNETGCEYVAWSFLNSGSITPRLSSEGRQICRK